MCWIQVRVRNCPFWVKGALSYQLVTSDSSYLSLCQWEHKLLGRHTGPITAKVIFASMRPSWKSKNGRWQRLSDIRWEVISVHLSHGGCFLLGFYYVIQRYFTLCPPPYVHPYGSFKTKAVSFSLNHRCCWKTGSLYAWKWNLIQISYL